MEDERVLEMEGPREVRQRPTMLGTTGMVCVEAFPRVKGCTEYFSVCAEQSVRTPARSKSQRTWWSGWRRLRALAHLCHWTSLGRQLRSTW